MDLFDRNLDETSPDAPLAARLRPRDLDEFVGQEHLVTPGKFLHTLIQQDRLSSMIFWGPPGTGKTTLAAIIARKTKSHFVFYSAVMGSVKEIREILDRARDLRKFRNIRTILFVDEIHRFNKGQQDAFLPHVERGLIVLIGATTENPSFEVNAALLSRCKVVTLNALQPGDIQKLLERALADREHGLAGAFETAPKVLDFLSESSYGDARRALTALETAATFASREGSTVITLPMAEEALQHKSLTYDKAGEQHYNVISAFIKSLRGSDPDAAVYWMTRMLEAGENPLFILRRMVIFASEDIGSANPRALQVAISAMEAFRFLGLPEGVLPMTQAATYLACSEKSNAVIVAYRAALADVKQHGPLDVPLHLRNAPTSLMKTLGYGKNYKYPHNFEGHYTPERYLPEALEGTRYYKPADSGEEREIGKRLAGWREKTEGGRATSPPQNSPSRKKT